MHHTKGDAHASTPLLTHHARQRCVEMGVRTKRVKAILRAPDMTYFSRDGHLAWRRDDPTIAVVYVEDNGERVAVTVIPRTQDRYARTPTGGTDGASARSFLRRDPR